MYFGNALFATYCIDDGQDGTHNYWESLCPPVPPSAWDIRWKGVRTTGGNWCIADGIFPRDYRSIPSNLEKRDTFKLFFGNLDFPDSSVSFSWQESTDLALRCDSMYFTYIDPLTSTLVKVDMFAQHSWDIPQVTHNGGYIFMTIYKFGCNIVDAVSETKAPTPQSVQLDQNYPNPFNPVTTISYELPSRVRVSLIVYDLLGREVVRLVDEVQSPGSKSVRFNGNGLASGIYFCRLSAGSTVLDRKIILLK
jgi:hypothetical protein